MGAPFGSTLPLLPPGERFDPARAGRRERRIELRLCLRLVPLVRDRVAREHCPGLPAAARHDREFVDAGAAECPRGPPFRVSLTGALETILTTQLQGRREAIDREDARA